MIYPSSSSGTCSVYLSASATGASRVSLLKGKGLGPGTGQHLRPGGILDR